MSLIYTLISGWDYSSRWFADGRNQTTIDILDIVPVELNAILARVEVTLRGRSQILTSEYY